MDKMKRVILRLLLGVVLIVSIPIAGAAIEPVVSYAAVKSEPRASVSNVTLYIGYKTYPIKFINRNKASSAIFKSSNPAIAKVDNKGIITPVKKGLSTVTVTVTQNRRKYTSRVKVTVENSNIKFTSKKSNLLIGDNYTYKASAYGSNYKITWSVSDKSVAKIDRKTGKLTALSAGEVDVIAESGNISGNYTVTISKGEFTTENRNITCSDQKIIYIVTKDMDDDEDIIFNIGDENIISCDWGDWEGDTIPLLIDPKKVGKTEITISSSKTAEKLVINVSVVKESDSRDKNAKVLTAKEIYAKCAPATAELKVDTADGGCIGSGFFIYSGVLITNYHVIEGATNIQVITYNQKTYDVTKILAYDKTYDIAILRIDAVTEHLTLNKGDIAAGEAVYALGSPRGLTGSLSNGIVASASRILEGNEYIQITAPISPGNSGGPLINEYGEVIGINTFILLDSENLNFALNVFQYLKLNFNTPITAAEYYEANKGPEPVKVQEDVSKSSSLGTAQTIINNNLVSGTLDISNNADYYHIQLTQSAKLIVVFTSIEPKDFDYLKCDIVDGNSNEIIKSDEITEDTGKYRVVNNQLAAGDYYIKAYSSDGNNLSSKSYTFAVYY